MLADADLLTQVLRRAPRSFGDLLMESVDHQIVVRRCTLRSRTIHSAPNGVAATTKVTERT
jgi:hypothetical protein